VREERVELSTFGSGEDVLALFDGFVAQGLSQMGWDLAAGF